MKKIDSMGGGEAFPSKYRIEKDWLKNGVRPTNHLHHHHPAVSESFDTKRKKKATIRKRKGDRKMVRERDFWLGGVVKTDVVQKNSFREGEPK